MGSILTRRPTIFDLATDFDQFFRKEEAAYTPAVEIKKNDREYVVTAHLPGIKRENLNVSVENGMLTISGKTEVREEKEYETVRSELVRASEFRRSLKIDERSFDVDKIEAKLDHGVLHVTLPIRPEVKPKQIDVKVQ